MFIVYINNENTLSSQLNFDWNEIVAENFRSSNSCRIVVATPASYDTCGITTTTPKWPRMRKYKTREKYII